MPVTVLSPNGGEIFQGSQSITTTWETTGAVSFHAVRLSTDGGVTFSNVTTTDLGGTARSFTFSLPGTASPLQAVIRVAAKDVTGSQIAKGDSFPFTIQAVQPVQTIVTVTSPAGGTFQGGQTMTVNWTIIGPVSTHSIQLSTNGGVSYIPVSPDLGATARTFSFSLPNPASPVQARIKVVAKGSTGAPVAEGLGALFSLQPLPVPVGTTVTVTAPAGGTFQSGQALTVNWNTTGPVSSHAVQLSTNAGTSYTNVTSSNLAAAARTFTFNLPNPGTASVQARVKVVAKSSTGAEAAQGTSAPFTLQPVATVPAPILSSVQPNTLAIGRATTVLVRGSNLPVNAGGYSIRTTNGAGVPGARVAFAGLQPTLAQVMQSFGLSSSALDTQTRTRLQQALGVTLSGTPPMELVVELPPGVTAGSYRLVATGTGGSGSAAVQAAANVPRSTFSNNPFLRLRGQEPQFSPNLPDPSMAAWMSLSDAQRSDLLTSFRDAFTQEMQRRAGAEPPLSIEADPLGSAAKRELGVERTQRKAAKIFSDALSFLTIQETPPAMATVDEDKDTLPDNFEYRLARAFLPLYKVSRGEKGESGGIPPQPNGQGATGFARFVPGPASRSIQTGFLPTQPVIHFRVKRLGITRGANGRRFAILEIDYFTLWTRDDGLPVPAILKNILDAVTFGAFEEALLGHIDEEERSAVLVAAELNDIELYPADASRYRAFELYTAAHEGTPVDVSAYLKLPVGGRIEPGKHPRFFFSRSKHGTYEFNPDFLPLLAIPIFVVIEVVLVTLFTVLFNGLSFRTVLLASLIALFVFLFFVIVVERFQDRGDAGIFVPFNMLINVGDIDMKEIAGAKWINETEPRGLKSKFLPIWTVPSPEPNTA